MIYIDDILKALKETQFEIVGIIYSDIYLSLESVHLNAIARQTQDALVCVNRVNVKKQGDSNSVSYVNGFGAFFFRRWLLERIPASRFCLGMPWWDYYMPTVCILNQIPLVCFQDLIACQICHPFNWDRVQWAHEAKYFFEQLLELCRQQEGYHPFWNLGYKFREAWKQYYLLLMNNCPVNYVQKSYFYAEFILGIIYGQMRALDVLSADRFERDSFSLPDISRVTHALMSPSLTLMPIDCDSGPLVSAIVSTYQAEEFIHGCLQDLIEQTLYKKGLLEIIVINSASPQNEGAIVRQFQNGYPNIRYIRTAQRETIYAAWNRGIQEARGKYITNANTDDRRHPQMLEMMAAVLEENTEKAAVYSHFYVTEIPNQNWNTKTPVRVADWHPPYSRLGLLKANFMGPQPMWRRTLHQEYGYFDPSFKVSGDWEFFLRVSQTHDFIKCSDVLGLYYFNPKSLERSAGTREIEDQFIRQLYIKNLNTIIRRPFNPQTECAFADAPEANRREFMPAQIEPSLISASCNSTSGQSEKDGERKALPAADSENSEQIPVEQKQNETLKQALFYFQLAMQRFEEKKLVSASRWMDQYRKSMDYKWLCPKRWKGSEGSCPALSVIVVTYNRHSELKNLLEDLQRQDFKDFEVLVVNNGSPVPDSCQELADLYIQCPLNLNLSEGRNIGVYFAQGQIGVFLDDDASVESGYLTSIASAFQTYEIAGMRGKTLPKSKNSGDSDCQIYNLGDRPFACLCNQEGNSAFRLDCWRAAGGMDPLLFGHEGSDLTARLIQLYGPASVIYWPQAIIYHDYGPTDKAREKQDRYWRNRQYLEYKFDADVIAIKDRLAQIALRRKGEGFVPGFAGLPPVDRSIQRSGVSSVPRVSILMTCYNAQLYLQECLDSLLGQTLQDWELIAIDDGSTDQTRNRLNHYAQLDPRIRVFCFDQQAGPYIRRNFAIQQARSELISIQDADDIAVPEKLEILCDEIERDPRLGIVGSFYRRFLEDFMPPEHGDLIDKMICHDSIMQAFSKCWHLCWHGSAVIRKELFSKIGLYDSHPWGSDTFWLSKAGLYARLTQSVRFKNVPECLTCKREHSQSQTGKISTVDPRGRRRYFEGFYLSKLEKIRDQVQQNPTLDAGALLRDCTSDDFVKYAENFSAFESEPMTKEMILQILKKAHLQFRMGQFVSALITLDYLAAADAPQYSQYIGADLIRGLCWFAIGQDGKARECLEREQKSHPTSKTEEMLGLVKSGEANALPIDQWKQMVLPLSSQAEIHYREFRIKSFESQKSDAAGKKKAPSDPVVSVYIVAYNSEAYIGQTIESVLSQTYPNFELLIVDDGSTDQTASIIQTFRDPRIRHLRQEHKNFAAGMNRAIQAARGEFVIGVDSDDWIDPDYLSRMAEHAAAHPEYEYYYPEKLTLVDAHGNPTGVEWPYEEIGNSNRLPAILFARGCSVIPNSGSLKRRSMFARTGLFRELDNAEDFDFMVRCGTQVRFKRVDHSSRYYYRRLQKNNSAQFEQRHPVTAECMEWMLRNYPPTALCPKLSELTDPTEQEIQFLGYVISVFEKLAKVHRDQSGWIFEEYAQKYRQKKSGLSKDFLAESPIIQGSLQNQLSLAQVHMEQGDLEKAAIIYRQILSNKKLMIHTELRETIQGLLLRLEAENRRSQKVYN
ncbi:MAG TPA: glycosyltransferase, partial [Anaerohalosphaeraceae bacterium]|nr:glycosyltransferase [Anaerohalosphaeraceae bacterium]